ncbi:MAG: hypothetical protein ACRDST_03950 [Pseudonocardiaceae bacterium]
MAENRDRVNGRSDPPEESLLHLLEEADTPATDHETLRRVSMAGRLAAGRVILWALAQSGDLLSQFLRPGPQQDVYAFYERMRSQGPPTAAAPGCTSRCHLPHPVPPTAARPPHAGA